VDVRLSMTTTGIKSTLYKNKTQTSTFLLSLRSAPLRASAHRHSTTWPDNQLYAR
jgi:hypothetical protein